MSNQLKATGNCSLLNYFVLAVIRSGTQLNSLASYRYMKVNDNFPLSFRKWNIEMNIWKVVSWEEKWNLCPSLTFNFSILFAIVSKNRLHTYEMWLLDEFCWRRVDLSPSHRQFGSLALFRQEKIIINVSHHPAKTTTTCYFKK